MTENTTLSLLQEKMNQIINDNPAKAHSKQDRDIFLFEDELRELGLSFEVEASLGELDESLNNYVFNDAHGFVGKDYILKWSKDSKTSLWSLFVVNSRSTGQKRLIDCPSEMKVRIISTFGIFATKIVNMLKA